jgi:hypothetical protein
MSRSNSDNEFKELDDFFSESLRDASVTPSREVWQGIEKNLEEKRKKRYLLWFLPSLVLLIGGAIGTYFLFSSDSANNGIAERKQAVVSVLSIVSHKSTNENNTSKNETITSKKNPETNSSTDHQIKKIQIAALKNHSADLPGEIGGHAVRSETGADNIKRFFVEVPSNEINSTVADLKSAGYKDAFVMGPKQDRLAFSQPEHSQKDPVVKNNIVPNNNPNTLIAATLTRSKEPKTEVISPAAPTTIDKTPDPKPNTEIVSSTPSTTGPVASSSSKTDNTKEEIKETPVVNTPKDLTNSGRSELTIHQSDPESAIITNSPAPTNSIAVLTSTETSEEKPKIDSVKPETKPGVASVPLQDKPDSVKPPLNTDPRFGIYILGGPVITQTLPDPKFAHEFSPVTYNGGFKLQFKPLKKLAVELGANYQTCSSVSQESYLYFNKFDPNDSYIHSSMGDMVVSHANLMNGFSMMGPMDTLRVKYVYKINYNVINIPLIVKFYPVKKDRLAISVFIAENNQLLVNKSADLTIIKEFWTENYSYKNIPGKNFNMSLMLGLGCEFKLYKNLHFVVEPNARYYITNSNTNPAIRAKRINFDGNAGFKINF